MLARNLKEFRGRQTQGKNRFYTDKTGYKLRIEIIDDILALIQATS